MALKPIYELDTITTIDENHTLLVYQDNRLKKLNAKDLFYSRDDINNNVIIPKNNIIKTLANLHVVVPSDATLYDLINYTDNIDVFEIGVRRLVHNGTDTTKISGNPSASNNPKYTNMGVPQTSSTLERCYKIGGRLTVIPRIDSPNSENDLIYANMSSKDTIIRNDFYGGDYASEKWKSGIYPWNEMERVIDDNGNYFTKVPLYFIKEEYITDTGIDLSASWPTIPNRFINNIIYKYTFVCKTKLPGYRPADFFYDYKPYTMEEDSEGLYVYIQDLDCYTIPLYYSDTDTRYSISDNSITTYTKILTRHHYFACYEASTETDNGVVKITSKPGMIPMVSTLISTVRRYCTNTDSSYFIRDIRSYTDFFCTLFEIEFATTNCQSIVNGVTSINYDNYNFDNVAQENAYDTNTIKVNCNITSGSYISIGSFLGFPSVAENRLVLSSESNNDGTYNITFDGKPVSITKGDTIWELQMSATGKTDISEFRSAYIGSSHNSNSPFKWNWIENPFANIFKFIDGIHIKTEEDKDGLLENCIYITNNPALYSDSFTGYNKVHYIMPSEFLNDSGIRTTGGSSYVSQLGYDPVYPWCQVPSKVGATSSTGYADYYRESSDISYPDESRVFTAGGSFGTDTNAGLYCVEITNDSNVTGSSLGACIQKVGE